MKLVPIGLVALPLLCGCMEEKTSYFPAQHFPLGSYHGEIDGMASRYEVSSGNNCFLFLFPPQKEALVIRDKWCDDTADSVKNFSSPVYTRDILLQANRAGRFDTLLEQGKTLIKKEEQEQNAQQGIDDLL